MNTKLQQYKSMYKRTPPYVHLNNAGQAVMSQPAYEAIQYWQQQFRLKGAFVFADLLEALDCARFKLSRFVGCDSTELAFFPSTSMALSQVAFGFDLKPGDEIIVHDQEFPSNFYPWREACKRSGAKLVVIECPKDLSVSLETIQSKVTSKTKIIASSWVQYRSGAKIELKELSEFARSRGIFTVIDGIQGVGCYPLNFHESGIDAICCGSHKWMSATHGAAFLALRKEHLEKLKPIYVGWFSFNSPGDKSAYVEDLMPNAKRFEPGGMAFAEIIALSEAANMFQQTGMDIVYDEAHRLATKLYEGLSSLGYQMNSPHKSFQGAIVNFGPSSRSPIKSMEALGQKLTVSMVSFTPRPPGIRLSPHAYNTDEEIDFVLKALS